MEDQPQEEKNYFNEIPFSYVCEVYEKIVSRKDKKKKCDILRAFINHHRERCGVECFHPLMRLILPQLERERGPYGVKEYNLARTYIRILCLPKEGVDAQKLLNYRNPTSVRASDVIGDFAEVAYWILRNKCGKSTKITVGDINASLDLISEKHASHDPRAVDEILISLFRKMSAEEQKWLIRIILKDMHLGLSTKQILYVFHPDSSEVYDLSNSLLKVCTMLKDPSIRYHELEIKLFEAFSPMLSERTDVSKLDMTETLLLETKFDGERFQLHYSNNKFKYFSRNGYEYTSNYGEDEYSGYLTMLIKKQLSPSITSLILDGEMMCWNSNRRLLLTKAANHDVKQLKMGNIIQPCFFPFDILHYNGEVLTNRPLLERKKLLDSSFQELEGTIMKAPYQTVSTNEEVLNAINAAIDRCEEGIILKKMDSVYKPKSRNSGWYKIKPEYTEGALIDLDLLILGGYYGHGKQKGKVSHFLMGLAVPNESGHPTKFQSLCRVGSGYSITELEELANKLAPSWLKLRPGLIPPSHLLAKEKPDLWIQPEKSCILQIKATEVVESKEYFFGSTLKFVRVQQIRDDKPWHDCLTTTQFIEIKNCYQGKLTSGPLQAGNRQFHRKKNNEIESLVAVKKTGEQPSSLTNILGSKEFSVINGFEGKSKESIEKMILENGGLVKNIPGSNTYCLIAGDMSLKVKNFCRSGKHVVAHFSWLNECLEKGQLVPWTPLSVAGTTLMGKTELNHNFDKYGDSYCDPVDENKLKLIMDRMKVNVTMSNDSLVRMNLLLHGVNNAYSFLCGTKAHFPKRANSVTHQKWANGRRLSLAQNLFKFCGGTSTDFVDESVLFIIVDTTEPFSLMDYNILVIDECGPDFCPKIVSTQWVFDCFKHKKLMPPLFEEYAKFYIICSNFYSVHLSRTSSPPVTKAFRKRMEDVPHLDVTVADDYKEGAYLILEKLRPSWPAKDIIFKIFTDGITNRLIGCSLSGANDDVILLRSYGKSTELFIDRKAEIRNFKILHREGYAPRFYATFNNGIAYEFVPGVILDETTCKDKSVFPLVAAMLARFHAIPVDEEEKNNPVLWTRLRKYFSLIPQQYTSEIKRKRFSEKFSRGLAGLEETISFLQRNLESEDLKVVFCHNDLLLANVICSDGSVTFIDYEYAGCSYQAFDIGNHFTEFAGVNNIDFARIPDKDFQHDWLKLYLAEYKSAVGESGPVTEDEIESLYQVVNKFILVSQVFWSTWALVQAEISELDFDFIDYAAMKMADYESRKNSIMPSGS
ncbi:DNA ligase [Nesidiocoris tenuis]|uniref:DNA ligase 4 n=1 Tax=Nesidiocoris tenuis TaxID=355587 RepID=A0ABN7AET1_9HEMI|nr:DNA ligase [Nesidiocoris tenuis]